MDFPACHVWSQVSKKHSRMRWFDLNNHIPRSYEIPPNETPVYFIGAFDIEWMGSVDIKAHSEWGFQATITGSLLWDSKFGNELIFHFVWTSFTNGPDSGLTWLIITRGQIVNEEISSQGAAAWNFTHRFPILRAHPLNMCILMCHMFHWIAITTWRTKWTSVVNS